MKDKINSIIKDSINAKRLIPIDKVELACSKIIECYENGNKLLVCGNGGSAADAQHMSGEFLNRFKLERKPWPCMALHTDTSIMTAIGNDYGFEYVFAKQLEAFGEEGDMLIGISTSGNSKNIICAIEKAKEKGIFSICFLGKDGGAIGKICDLPIIVPSSDTPRIQEAHELIMHIICEITEKALAEGSK